MANVRWYDECDETWLSAVGKVTSHKHPGKMRYLWISTTGEHGRCDTPESGMDLCEASVRALVGRSFFDAENDGATGTWKVVSVDGANVYMQRQGPELNPQVCVRAEDIWRHMEEVT